MSRLLLLSILILWMCPRDNVVPVRWAEEVRLLVFLGGYALLVGVMSAWSRLLARRVGDGYLGVALDRYNRATELARYFVPVWLAVGIFVLGWGRMVFELLEFMQPAGLPRRGAESLSETYWRIPGLIVGTLPPFLAWMGLWWAQYPADRAFKEQSVLYHANEGLPIHAPPAFGTFFVEHIRQQMGMTLAPILLILLARDMLALTVLFFRDRPMVGGDIFILPLALGVFVLAPELLKRVIPTQPLPPNWALRKRLEALCERAGLRYRDILLWKTNSSMGNAMVMGLVPQVRYVFLSDLLLETMSDEEIEAVFAHELGHIVHRHMWWYVAFSFMLMLFAAGPLTLAMEQVPWLRGHEMRQAQVVTLFGLGAFLLLFGFLSRRFERQADVYAARTMQMHRTGSTVMIRHINPETHSGGGLLMNGLATAAVGAGDMHIGATVTPSAGRSHVGEYGASVVAGALDRVARINNIPQAANEWLHGSIAGRKRYLLEMSVDGARTAAFDKYMRRLYWALFAVLMSLGGWVGVQYGLAGI